jgi:hypothetical protein
LGPKAASQVAIFPQFNLKVAAAIADNVKNLLLEIFLLNMSRPPYAVDHFSAIHSCKIYRWQRRMANRLRRKENGGDEPPMGIVNQRVSYPR